MADQQDDHLGVPEKAAVQEFAMSFQGELIRPEDDGWLPAGA